MRFRFSVPLRKKWTSFLQQSIPASARRPSPWKIIPDLPVAGPVYTPTPAGLIRQFGEQLLLLALITLSAVLLLAGVLAWGLKGKPKSQSPPAPSPPPLTPSPQPPTIFPKALSRSRLLLSELVELSVEQGNYEELIKHLSALEHYASEENKEEIKHIFDEIEHRRKAEFPVSSELKVRIKKLTYKIGRGLQ